MPKHKKLKRLTVVGGFLVATEDIEEGEAVFVCRHDIEELEARNLLEVIHAEGYEIIARFRHVSKDLTKREVFAYILRSPEGEDTYGLCLYRGRGRGQDLDRVIWWAGLDGLYEYMEELTDKDHPGYLDERFARDLAQYAKRKRAEQETV